MGHSADVAACVLMDDRRIRGRRPAHRRHERLVAMLFHVSWDFVDASEEGTARSLKVLAGWQPPAGADFKGFFGRADGSGGVALIEADSVATLSRTTAPWTPWLRFTITPILPIEESSAIAGEGVAFRASIA